MKILYLANYELNNNSGVTQKIMAQLSVWQESGHKVKYLSLNTLAFYSVDGAKISDNVLNDPKGFFNVFLNVQLSAIKLKSILKNVEFDLVYSRYLVYSPFFKSALKNKPLIVEMNSNDITESKLRTKVGYYYNNLFRNCFLNIAKGFICVSREIEQETLQKQNVPVSIIANGIETKKFQFADLNKKKISLVFIGTPGSSWHGIDKIEDLSSATPEFDYHVIGESGNNTENLFYHGYLALKETIDIIKECHIGISTLALHRKNMNEASPLKSRQYLAMGLPIIYAYEDTDFDTDYTFTLKLENYENNIIENVEKIKAFVLEVAYDSSVHLDARNFAIKRLDTYAKEYKRLSFFESIIYG